MVQIDIPAGFVVSMLAIDLGRQALIKHHRDAPAEKSALYYRYLFRSVLFAGMVITSFCINAVTRAGSSSYKCMYISS